MSEQTEPKAPETTPEAAEPAPAVEPSIPGDA